MQIEHREHKVSSIRTQILRAANEQGLQFADCYRVEHKPNAMLVMPINDDPYVVVFKGDREAETHQFHPIDQSSGTDSIRARMKAKLFFDGVAA